MNDHGGGMAGAEQDNADGVLSRGSGVGGVIRIPSRNWHAHDRRRLLRDSDGFSAVAAACSPRVCGRLESVVAVGLGDRGHGSITELVGASKRAIRSTKWDLATFKALAPLDGGSPSA
jgi:hypothetical protein